ncbi:hypothetical protein C2G38_2186249 [Gigaspora rosea]|uniref:Uncharacterized protein n=1 Tax=Gigaspora rosea TaxID=44941 RepID=A0A397V5X7_9GLOM|nr:hypothetical protein C2G38_2186249 [Gigaspora rosea]
MDNSLPFICGTDIYHCIKKEIYSSLTNDILNPKDKQSDKLAERFFSSTVLRVLDFLLISEKILKTIKIEMKGNLIRPDNNDGYNIKLSTSKENFPEELSNFLSVFEINNVVKGVSSTMKNILCSLGIKINQEEFSSLIQQLIYSLKKNNNDEILLEGINNNLNISTEEEIEEVDLLESDINQLDDVDILLNKHQQRLLGRLNLSNLNFTNLNQIYDEEIHLDLESESEENFFKKINKIYKRFHKLNPLTIMQIMSDYREKYDYYTQQEKRKIGNKAILNKKNLTVVTELGTMDITTAIRYDRLNSNEQQIRTKGRIAR